MTILGRILEQKRKEVILNREKSPVNLLEKSKLFDRATYSLADAIIDGTNTGIIAEFKRRSPSKGNINLLSRVSDVTKGYIEGGAAGVSVLTDNVFFGGSSSDITDIRNTSSFPILRKDFIIDEYQVVEAKAIGADAILLIAAALERQQAAHLGSLAHSLGLQVLLEIHTEEEVEYISEYVDIVGVNNRNLKTFEVSIELSEKIAPLLPAGIIQISESGISSPGAIKRLRRAGFNGFLIGERFMSDTDPVSAFNDFVKQLS
jgi:indole-3-glycerol phosphate synthase